MGMRRSLRARGVEDGLPGTKSQVVSTMFLMLAGLALPACGGAWTARICTSNASGNCNGVTPFPKHHQVKSVQGFTDVKVQDPDCPNGFGEVAVTVIDRNNLDLVVYCLSDRPANSPTTSEGTLTLPETPGTPTPAPAPAHP